MKKSQHMILALTLVGLIAGGALVGVFAYTEPLIKANQQNALEQGVIEVLPGAVSFRTLSVGGNSVYEGISSGGEVIGYAVLGEGPGYQGTIQLMIGVDPAFEDALAIQILESVETPGLGGKITTPGFRRQFEGIVLTPSITLIKKEPLSNNEVQAITGATISSQAVVDIVNAAVSELRRAMATN